LDFEELYLRLREPVLRWATGCLRNRQDAEDVVSEGFEALRRALPKIRSNSPRAVDAYFYTIVRNLIARPRPKGEPLLDNLALVAEEPEDEPVWLTTTQAELQKAIERLEEVDQRVIVLALFERLPHREIASRLSLSTPNAVAIRLFRAKQALRALVEEELARRVPPLDPP
jgi:RNA polymerase sigma factor (sigma-70 family)